MIHILQMLVASLLIASGLQSNATVSLQTLETYVGAYRVAPNANLVIAVEGDHLTGQLGPQKFPLAAQSQTKFLVTGVGVEIEFVKDDKDAVDHIVVRQNGGQQIAPRVKERNQIAVAPDILQRYVGRYALPRPGFALVITMEGGQLVAESIGQFKYPLFAESQTSFFFKDVDAQIDFEKDVNGAATYLVLHRGSVHEKAPKN